MLLFLLLHSRTASQWCLFSSHQENYWKFPLLSVLEVKFDFQLLRCENIFISICFSHPVLLPDDHMTILAGWGGGEREAKVSHFTGIIYFFCSITKQRRKSVSQNMHVVLCKKMNSECQILLSRTVAWVAKHIIIICSYHIEW